MAPADPTALSNVHGLPNMKGSVDGGAEHGIGTFGGILGFPLMIGCICMFATTVLFYVKSISAEKGSKKFYYVAMSVTGIAAVAYMCMRANIGISYVECAHGSCGDYKALETGGGKTYPLFWMRYIDWFFTTPFFLLDLCLLADACVWETFFVMLMNALCIVCGAVGALKPSINVPMFILGMLTFCAFIEKLAKLSPSPHYMKTMGATMGIWCAYPVMFLICEMTHIVSTHMEVWLYMVLDVAAKCGCGLYLCLGRGHEAGGAGSSYGSMH